MKESWQWRAGLVISALVVGQMWFWALRRHDLLVACLAALVTAAVLLLITGKCKDALAMIRYIQRGPP
ncbi:MAG: hypothetical protein KGI71_05435 [Patescibacteria group bacterium]|nr:hypothetical protein [Patescibacteria group bacterium]